MRKTLLTSILIVHAIAVSSQAVTRYVPSQYSTIQTAINACNNGDIIVVADGIYTGNGNRDIDFGGRAITLKSQNGPNNCIIDCNGRFAEPHRGFYFHNNEDANSILSGFTIRNGYARFSSGDYRNCGGAILCFWSNPTITNCIIYYNSARSYGGGIYCKYSSPAITNCTIFRNSVQLGGGGLYLWYSSTTLTNCTISNNSAASGGGVFYSAYTSLGMLTNCILWGNSPNESMWGPWGEEFQNVTYCDIKGGYAGEGNIDADPLFVDSSNDDYHLSLNSPCINAGDPNGDYTDQNDIDGEPRLIDSRVDIGADEYRPPSYPISDPVTGTATQAGSGLGETDPNRMVEITNGDTEIKFVPVVPGGGSVTITELSCQTIEGDGVIIVENIRGIRAITALDNGDFISTLKVFYEEQDLPEGWTKRDLRIAQLQGIATMPRWVAEFALDIMNPSPTYGPPTLELGDWGVDEEGNYVWANIDHFSDYGVGVKLVTGDYDGNRNVDFRDFSHFALNWQDVNCPDFEWCNGTDLDFSTVVDFNDLQIFTSNWLYDANDPNT